MLPWIICGILAFLLLLLFVPIRLKLSYCSELFVKLSILFLNIRLFPRKKKVKIKSYSKRQMEKQKRKEERRAAKEAKKRAKKPPKPPAPPPPKKTVKDYMKILRQVIYILKRTEKRARGAFSIHISELFVLVATGDAASTAIAYGGVSQSVSYLLALSEGFVKTTYKARRIAVTPDYCGTESKLSVKIILKTNLWRLLRLAISALIAYFASQKIKEKTEN